MIYKLEDTTKVSHLFDGWDETLIYSCLQKVMGEVYVTDLEHPQSAYAYVGCFAFYAGIPDRELVLHKPEGFVIMTPQDEAWGNLIEECFPDCTKRVRYATRKDTRFDKAYLKSLVAQLPAGYELKPIDGELYDLCLKTRYAEDFVSCFADKDHFLQLGRGMVILKDGKIASGSSSYTRYNEGIEIEFDTAAEERCKGLGTIASAALILQCLEEGLYPSWDAQNSISLHVSEKLGYEFSHEYVAYEVGRVSTKH